MTTLKMTKRVDTAAMVGLISFDELIIALFISSPTLSTLPKKLWDGLRTEINPTIAAVSTLLVILSVVILLGAGWARKHFEKKTQ